MCIVRSFVSQTVIKIYIPCNGSVNWWIWYKEYYSYFIRQRALL